MYVRPIRHTTPLLWLAVKLNGSMVPANQTPERKMWNQMHGSLQLEAIMKNGRIQVRVVSVCCQDKLCWNHACCTIKQTTAGPWPARIPRNEPNRHLPPSTPREASNSFNRQTSMNKHIINHGFTFGWIACVDQAYIKQSNGILAPYPLHTMFQRPTQHDPPTAQAPQNTSPSRQSEISTEKHKDSDNTHTHWNFRNLYARPKSHHP